MNFDHEKFYNLMPAIYRIRDAERGEPLRALLSVVAEQVAVIEEDLAQLYDDQFIETCAEWVVPYIGDLVGARNLLTYSGASFSNRAQVANTIAYRRRKGTAAVLEQLARDVTGWDASVVEFFQFLSTTQYMNHLRPNNLATPDMRRWEPLERADTPFDSLAHIADVRRIEPARGKYNIPNVGIFLWRLQSFSLTDAAPYRVDDRRFRFNPLGTDVPLYNRPETEKEITHLAEFVNVPAPLSRRVLDRDKEIFYGSDKSLMLSIGETPIEASEIVICDLSDAIGGGDWAHTPADKYAIDPALGRFTVPQGSDPAAMRVTFHYGFSAEMGGGEYGRAETFAADIEPVIEIPTDKATIQGSLEAINALEGSGVIELENNDYHIETPDITVAAGAKIEVRASDERRGVLALSGDVEVFGGEDSEVTLNGLVIVSGRLVVPSSRNGETNNLRVLRLRHCTLLPVATPAMGEVPAEVAAPSRLVVEAANVRIEIDRCITGKIRAVDAAHVRITNSIVDAETQTAVAYSAPDETGAGAPLEIENCTVIGKTHALTLHASNTIFYTRLAADDDPLTSAPVRAERLQEGCMRFSYLPPESQVPRRFQCQPKPTDGKQQRARVRPLFTSRHYGDAGYCQLSPRCAAEIRHGADDEAEMGAFHHLYQSQRAANLRARLDEYLRFSLEAGILYAS